MGMFNWRGQYSDSCNYRAKDVSTAEWVYGRSVHKVQGQTYFSNLDAEDGIHLVYTDTVCKWTGYLDFHERLIYTGDVVEAFGPTMPSFVRCVVQKDGVMLKTGADPDSSVKLRTLTTCEIQGTVIDGEFEDDNEGWVTHENVIFE